LSYSTTVLATTGLVGYWRLGEPSGATATDATAATNGAYVNTPTLGVTGALAGDTDTAVTFTAASTQYVTIASNPSTATDNFGIECWLKLPSLTDQLGVVVSNGSDDANGWAVTVSGNNVNGHNLYGLYQGIRFLDSGYTFADTNWHHIVMTRESATLKWYVDAVATANTDNVFSPNAPASSHATIAAQHQTGTTYFHHFNGTVDEVAIYNAALPAATVLDHYTVGITGAPDGAYVRDFGQHTIGPF
jgi:hypothetical protein